MMSDEMVIVIKHAAVVIMVRWLPKMFIRLITYRS